MRFWVMCELNIAEKDLIYRITQKPALRLHFFKRIRGLKWFDDLLQNGFFNPSEIPTPILDEDKNTLRFPFWPILYYLTNISAELEDEKNLEYSTKVLNVIRDAWDFAQNTNIADNYRIWLEFVKILSKIPVELIDLNDLDILDIGIHNRFDRGFIAEEIGVNWLPKLLKADIPKSKEIALILLEKLFSIDSDIYESVKNNQDISLPFDSWFARNIIDASVRLSGEKIGIDAVEIFVSNARMYLEYKKNDSWSSFWRKTIEDSEVGYEDALDNILVTALRECLFGLSDGNSDSFQRYMENLLDDKVQTIKRIAIYVSDEKYDLLPGIAFNVIRQENFCSNMMDELWNFIRNNFNAFDVNVKRLIFECIESLTLEEEYHDNAEAINYQKSLWLSSIKDMSVEALTLYEQYSNNFETKPNYQERYKTPWISLEDESTLSYSVDDILCLNLEELIDLLKSHDSINRPNINYTSRILKECIKLEPYRFSKELAYFKDLDPSLVYSIFDAYNELWKNKSPQNWNFIWRDVLIFADQIVSDKKSEQVLESTQFYPSFRDVFISIADFITEGTRVDEHAFSEEYIPLARKILRSILLKQNQSLKPPFNDALVKAINSSRGRVLIATINLALRECRLSDIRTKNHYDAWMNYEDIFANELFNTQDSNYEFSCLIAQYSSNFLYMNRQWFIDNIDYIFDKDKYHNWSCAMQGYSYVRSLDDEVYFFLKNNGSLMAAIDDKSFPETVRHSLIRKIVSSAYHGIEDFNSCDALINALLRRNRRSELDIVIRFIWNIRNSDRNKIVQLVSYLWPEILSIIDLNTRDGQFLASLLCLWFSVFNRIDDECKELILACAPFVEEAHNSYEFLKKMAELSEHQPLEVFEIWKSALQFSAFEYPPESIQTIFKNLLQQGSQGRRYAVEIVDTYIRYGSDNPKLILDKLIDSVASD